VGAAHGKRLITAAVALPILAWVVVWGHEAGFAILVSIVATLALFEYYDLLLPEETFVAKGVGGLCGLALLGGFYFHEAKAVLAILVAAFFVLSVFYLFRPSSASWTVERLSKQILGLVYIPFFLGHAILIRNEQEGLSWVVMLITVVIAADSGAYYVGKNLGRRKLCPRISPGKTVEGSVGGLIAAVLVGGVVKVAAFSHLSWLSCIGLAAIVAVMSQIGDLVESVLKRSVDAKDSGRLLPGHGGVLDRIDGLLFALPALYYLKHFML